MRGLLFILGALLLIMCIREIEGRQSPLLIDAHVVPAGGEWCDVSPKRPPILRTPQNRVDYRVGRPFNDRGVA